MRKAFLLTLFLGFCALGVNAAEQKVDVSGSSEMQKFYYNLGKEEAKKQYYLDGYRQAMSDFEVLLRKYKTKIQAYEAGKYLIRESKITYPKVYRIKDAAGAYKIQIDSPSVEKAFDEHDLFMIPLGMETDNSQQSTKKQEAPEDSGIKPSSDGFSIPARDDVTLNRDSAPEVTRKKATVHIPYRNDGIKAAIDSFNIPYAATKDGYDLFFSTLAEKIDFCMKVTGNAECQI